ncbi:MAG: hypothetical protein WCL44_07220 [bacterium]
MNQRKTCAVQAWALRPYEALMCEAGKATMGNRETADPTWEQRWKQRKTQ